MSMLVRCLFMRLRLRLGGISLIRGGSTGTRGRLLSGGFWTRGRMGRRGGGGRGREGGDADGWNNFGLRSTHARMPVAHYVVTGSGARAFTALLRCWVFCDRLDKVGGENGVRQSIT